MSTMFNMAVDSLVYHWMQLTVEEESATHEVLGTAVGHCMGVLFLDNGIIGSRDPEYIQGSINVLIGIFIRVRLMKMLQNSIP